MTKSIVQSLALLLSVICSVSVWACSFAPGFELFQFGVPDEHGIGPQKPVLIGYEITRGYNDGDYASCSDAGVLELRFERTHGVGYLFEPIGSFEDRLFPEEIVQFKKGKDLLSFVWLDGSRDVQESIDLAVKVTAFYPNGKSSEAIEIRLLHLGGSSERGQ